MQPSTTVLILGFLAACPAPRPPPVVPLPPGGGGKITWVHVSTAEVPSTSPAPGTYRVYGKTTLPDHEVVEELTSQGATVLRTDVEDGTCGVKGKIGGDDGPGGCDSWVITIRP